MIVACNSIENIGLTIINIREQRHLSEAPRKPFYKIRYLYLLQSIIGGPVKIGVSEDVSSRVYGLQSGSAFELVVVRTMSFDSMYLSAHRTEKFLHKEFKEYKVRGEWFKEDVINILDSVADKFNFDFYSKKGIIANDIR